MFNRGDRFWHRNLNEPVTILGPEDVADVPNIDYTQKPVPAEGMPEWELVKFDNRPTVDNYAWTEQDQLIPIEDGSNR